MLSLQKNYLQKYQQIYPQNLQWNAIQYKLQLNLGNASVELKRVFCVANPYLSSQFQKQNKGFIINQVYIKPQNLIGSNRIERVCQKGFDLNAVQGNNGIIFTMGQIQNVSPLDKDKIQHQLLVLKICPRRTYPVIATQQTLNDDYRIPQGFDSIYFKDPNEDKEVYRHKFRINKKMQTLPYYLIQFKFNNNHEEKFKKILCQNCQDLVATYYCITQKTYFCSKCDFEHHKDKISSKHQRKPLTQKPILNFGYCLTHKQNKNELFCKECNQSMCISCKIQGTHAGGAKAKHELQKISDYFNQITTKIDQMDPSLQKRKDQLQQLLAVVQNKISEINIVTSNTQAKLAQMFQEALKDLQIISRKNLSYLISDQLEIRRQYDYIQWMESFLKYQFNVLPPINFLASWTKHLKLRKEILNISNIPALSDIKPNFKIYGRTKVMEDDKVPRWVQEDEDMDQISTKKKNINNKNEIDKKYDKLLQQNEGDQSYFRKKLFANQSYRPE